MRQTLSDRQSRDILAPATRLNWRERRTLWLLAAGLLTTAVNIFETQESSEICNLLMSKNRS